MKCPHHQCPCDLCDRWVVEHVRGKAYARDRRIVGVRDVRALLEVVDRHFTFIAMPPDEEVHQ